MKPQMDYGKFALAYAILMITFFGYDYFRKRNLARAGVTTEAVITSCGLCHYSFCYDYIFVVGSDTCRGTISSSIRLSYQGNEGCVGRRFLVTYNPDNCFDNALDLTKEIP